MRKPNRARDGILNSTRCARVLRLHLDELALAARENPDHRRGELVRHVDHQVLDGLVLLAVDVARDDPWGAHLHLVTLAAHGLEQDRQVQLPTPGDLELVRTQLLDAQGYVGLYFSLQAVVEVARRDVLALLAREGGGAGLKQHADRRLIYRNDGQRLGVGEIGDRLTDLGVLDAGEGHDVARAHLLGLDALQPEVREGLRYARLGHRAVFVDQVHELATLDLAAPHAPHHDAPQVLGVVEVGDQHLEGGREVHLGRGDLLEDGLEQLPHVVPRRLDVSKDLALARVGVQDGKVQLLVRGAQLSHQVEGEVDDLFGPGVGPVDLVDNHDGLEAQLDRLAQHEARLRHRTLGRVHQQQAAIHHAEDALDLATEVSVAGRIHDVDLDAAVLHGGVLGQDGDAALLSRTLLSMARSVISWPWPSSRVCFSRPSTRVVLPWSTCEMMAILRYSMCSPDPRILPRHQRLARHACRESRQRKRPQGTIT